MKPIRRNLLTPEGRDFWAKALKSAEGVREWPDWMKAGINAEPPGSHPLKEEAKTEEA